MTTDGLAAPSMRLGPTWRDGGKTFKPPQRAISDEPHTDLSVLASNSNAGPAGLASESPRKPAGPLQRRNSGYGAEQMRSGASGWGNSNAPNTGMSWAEKEAERKKASAIVRLSKSDLLARRHLTRAAPEVEALFGTTFSLVTPDALDPVTATPADADEILRLWEAGGGSAARGGNAGAQGRGRGTNRRWGNDNRDDNDHDNRGGGGLGGDNGRPLGSSDDLWDDPIGNDAAASGSGYDDMNLGGMDHMAEQSNKFCLEMDRMAAVGTIS
jgi:hypothetical protein